MLDKWKRAIVHLESAANSEQFYEENKRLKEWRESAPDQWRVLNEKLRHYTRDIRVRGTALLLSDNNRRYLVTARHVLWDEIAAKQCITEVGPYLDNYSLNNVELRARDSIYSIIFRVPRYDEVSSSCPEFLMNLGAGTPHTHPYIFSEPNIDLAIISLDQRNRAFADELVALGYVPVTLDDIWEGPTSDGQDVFTIGFPQATSIVSELHKSDAEVHWSSTFCSLPVSSFGKVSMLHDDLPFFWADMSIYPGNSGGPVVSGDRLIGIISGQPCIPCDQVPDITTRIPFARIIKSGLILPLLEMQRKRDELAARMFGLPIVR